MTATTNELLPHYAGRVPEHASPFIAANVLILKGTLVALDSAGRATIPGAGRPIIGIAQATYDNRTGSVLLGGAADAIRVECDCGIFGFAVLGTAPVRGERLYAVDNQTVSLDPTGSRGYAGPCIQVDSAGRAYAWLGPQNAASPAAGPDALDIPLGTLRLSTGAAVPAFGNGTADGFAIVDSKTHALRINDDSTTIFSTNIRLPESLRAGSVITLHALLARIGSTDTTATLTPHVFAASEGAAEDAGSDLVTGDFAAVSGATKVVQEVTKVLSGGVAGDVLSLTLVATAALANDDMLVLALWLTFA